MILNGPEGSLKGHTFDVNKPESLPRYLRALNNPNEQLRQAMALNDRYRIVDTCNECGHVLIAEEVAAHRMDHVPSKLRAFVRTLMAVPEEDRQQIIKWVTRLEAGIN